VIEDDYDSECRFDGGPLPTLADLDGGERVAYVGTFSKVLSPALRIGYVVAPPALHERLVRLKRLTDHHTTWPVQRALAAMLDAGDLERHVRRVRREYARKRSVLLRALAPICGLARPLGLDAGLHCCLLLGGGLVAEAVATRARAAGVGVATLDDFYLGPVERQGLLLGYGGLEEGRVRRGAEQLVQIIRQLARAGEASADRV
jgi:GntR family transcriptional regulator/MocR family aminotransferase